jgi:hypothetical protein
MVLTIKVELEKKGISYKGVKIKENNKQQETKNNKQQENDKQQKTENGNTEKIQVDKTHLEQTLRNFHSTNVETMISNVIRTLFPQRSVAKTIREKKNTADDQNKTPEKNTERNGFIGIKDLDMHILMNLEDKDLPNVCKTSKYLRDLCELDDFWKQRFLKYFGQKEIDQILKFKKSVVQWKHEYQNKALGIANVYFENDFAGAKVREKRRGGIGPEYDEGILIKNGLNVAQGDFLVIGDDIYQISKEGEIFDNQFGTKHVYSKDGMKFPISLVIYSFDAFKLVSIPLYFKNLIKFIYDKWYYQGDTIDVKLSFIPIIKIRRKQVNNITFTYDKNGHPIKSGVAKPVVASWAINQHKNDSIEFNRKMKVVYFQ